MQAYEVSKSDSAAPIFAPDLASVRQVVRTIAKDARRFARVYLVAFSTDKPAIVALLNGQPLERQHLRGWQLTARGALLELTPAQLAAEVAP